MGCGVSQPQVDETTKRLNAELAADKKKEDKVLKLLLLGIGESGKSTVMKQARLHNNMAYNDEERRQMIPFIWANIFESLSVLLTAMESRGKKLFVLPTQPFAEEYRTLSGGRVLRAEDAPKITALWTDPTLQEIYADRSTLRHDSGTGARIPGSCKYFLDNIGRVAQSGYVPTQEDVLWLRVRTIGIHELRFRLDDLVFQIMDVGGQRGERRKWVHCFTDVSAIIFVLALDCYDLVLEEDERVNAMDETLKLYEEVANSKWFKDIPIIVFMNKMDLFRDKISRVDLKVHFPDYEGGLSYENATQYLEGKVQELNRVKGKPWYLYYTCAVDSKMMGALLKAVLDSFVLQQFNKVGL